MANISYLKNQKQNLQLHNTTQSTNEEIFIFTQIYTCGVSGRAAYPVKVKVKLLFLAPSAGIAKVAKKR